MKFKQYLDLLADDAGFIPLPHFRWDIRKNPRKTAREEAIAAEVLRQANPCENISGHFPWGPEEQLVLQQLWIHPESTAMSYRDVPTPAGKNLYSVEPTEFGDLPVPNAIKEPGTIRGNFRQRLRDILGEDRV